jgi:hypothetical protein
MMRGRLRALGLVPLAVLLVAACGTVTPTPVNSPGPSASPASPSTPAIAVACDGFGQALIRCTDAAQQAIALLPSPHPAVLALRVVYNGPVGHIAGISPTITVGFILQGQAHVVGHSYIVENGTLVSTGSF